MYIYHIKIYIGYLMKKTNHIFILITLKYIQDYFVEIVKESVIETNGTLRAATVKRICTNNLQLKKFTKNKVLRT